MLSFGTETSLEQEQSTPFSLIEAYRPFCFSKLFKIVNIRIHTVLASYSIFNVANFLVYFVV